MSGWTAESTLDLNSFELLNLLVSAFLKCILFPHRMSGINYQLRYVN